ncbi:MAG: DUF58 domain-containing protein [Verrucomicrobiota bacterium]
MSGKTTITLEELVLLKADAHGFSFLPTQPIQSLLAGRHASRLRGRGLAFEELRHYNQGDDVRTIDWKATARLRAPHVRVYSEERERPVLLVVDQRTPMYFGSRRSMKSVVAAELAALGAWRTLQAGDRVGGLVFNEESIVEIRPQRSQARVLQLLHEVSACNKELTTTDAISGDVTLNRALESALRLAKHDHLIILVSDLDGADSETKRIATQLARHNDVLIIAVYDPLGASLQGHSGMIAKAGSRSLKVPSGKVFANSFRQGFEQRMDEWTEIFRSLRVPVLPISTAQPVADQLRTLFGKPRP